MIKTRKKTGGEGQAGILIKTICFAVIRIGLLRGNLTCKAPAIKMFCGHKICFGWGTSKLKILENAWESLRIIPETKCSVEK